MIGAAQQSLAGEIDGGIDTDFHSESRMITRDDGSD
jgi:hypothetical protein